MNLLHLPWLFGVGIYACKLRLSDSKLPGVGQGVFAGSPFKEGETIVRSREMLMRREVVEHTPFWNYAFHLQQGKVMSVLLGAASMLNHGGPEMVNVRFSRISESVIEVVANRDIREGEELFTSYGSEDWFLDRQIAYQKPNDLSDVRLSSNSKTGDCLDIIAPDISSKAIIAQQGIAVGETIHSPFFLIPRWLSQTVEVMSHCFGHPAWDVVVLPFLLPGSLVPTQEDLEANVVYSMSMEKEVAESQMHDALNTHKSSGVLRLKALRHIKPGEKLIAKINAEIPLLPGLPKQWESINFWQSQISAAEAGDANSQFKVAEAFRLRLRRVNSDALGWYRRAAQQGHLEATFRAAATIHDMLGAQKGSSSALNDASQLEAALEAAAWYLKASEKGHVRAQLLLTEMLSDGKFLLRNLSAAAFWGRRALASGASRVSAFCETFYELAMAFQEQSDRSAEFFWLQVAAEAGSSNAQYVLGQGLGDTPEALNLLHQAATQGHVDAAFSLAVAFLEGPHQNVSSAVSWFRVAANQGHGAAQYNLGIALKQQGSSDEAEYWLKKAAANGFREPGTMQQLQALRDRIALAASALRRLFTS